VTIHCLIRGAIAAMLGAAALSPVSGTSQRTGLTSTVAQEPVRSAKDTWRQLESLACGDSQIKLSMRLDKATKHVPQASADKALMYVFESDRNRFSQIKLAVDRKWVGVTKGRTYFFVLLDPGPHYFCSDLLGDHTLLSLVVEAGKTYYLEQREVTTGPEIDLMDEEKAQIQMLMCKLSTFEEKK